MNDHFELVNVEKALNKQRNSSVSVVRHAMGDNAFDKDPFNQPELVFTLRGKELVIFVLGYIFAVLLILALFESVMPVYFVNDSQPFEVKE
ncbi:hypothetical protein L596_001617 [Steinernema carpocapsae]|uniref:Uncharacterized protein n=1 Tax=Steinernema carpocapsae TaxID=34508 RepID=A0A4U8ULQ9_STECR|nr:hypothetical protein L596_001617 [Steinernema carpocapsae]